MPLPFAEKRKNADSASNATVPGKEDANAADVGTVTAEKAGISMGSIRCPKRTKNAEQMPCKNRKAKKRSLENGRFPIIAKIWK